MEKGLNEAIISATQEILRGILGPDVKHVTAVNAAEVLRYDVSVIVGLAGKITGAIILKCPRKMGIEVANKMLGIEVGEDSVEMRDAIAEMMNMIICKAKTGYSDERAAIAISVPSTIVGREYTLHMKAGSESDVTTLNFRHDGYIFNIIVYLKK